jgi:hypothetical protein
LVEVKYCRYEYRDVNLLWHTIKYKAQLAREAQEQNNVKYSGYYTTTYLELAG